MVQTANTARHTTVEGLGAVPFQGASLLLADRYGHHHQEGKACSPSAPGPDGGLQSQCHGFEHHERYIFSSQLKNELEENEVLEQCQYLG